MCCLKVRVAVYKTSDPNRRQYGRVIVNVNRNPSAPFFAAHFVFNISESQTLGIGFGYVNAEDLDKVIMIG